MGVPPLPLHQAKHMLFEKIQVERIERLIVLLPIFIEGCFVSFYKIIIERDTHWREQVHQQLNLQSFAEGGLS